MAGEHEINLNINAKDKASKTLDSVAKKVDALDSEPVEITVEAKVAQALDALTEIADESKRAEQAAEALSRALGPQLTATANMDQIIAGFERAGLSLDEITANADQLGTKLRDIGSQSTGGLDAALKRSKVNIDEVNVAGEKGRNVLANMVGNTAQDLGQLGALAGSAGVAIGQMGEYFADATLAGEGFKSAAIGMSKVLGPIVALAVGLEVVKGAVAAFGAEAKHNAADVKAWRDAMEDGGDAVNNIAQDLTQLTHNAKEAGGGFGPLLDALSLIPAAASKLVGGPEFGILADNVDSISDALVRGGITADTFWRLVTDERGTGAAQLRQLMIAAGASIEDQNAVVDAAIEKQLAWLDAQDQTYAAQRLLRKTTDDVVASFEEFVDAQTEVEDMPAEWNAVADAIVRMRRGLAPTAEQLAAVNALIAKGVPPESIWSTGSGIIEERAAEMETALDSLVQGMKDWRDQAIEDAEAADDFGIALAEAQGAVDELGGAFGIMARREDAISKAFALGNAPLDALAAVRNIDEAIRDLGTFIRDEGVPNIFDPNDVDAAPFLSKIESLRGPIQAKITEAFAAGGPAAATAVADGYVRQITESMRGRLTEQEVRTLLGLGDLTATLKIAVDQESLAATESLLAILTGLGGETPYTASIKLALEAGEITPDVARQLVLDQLRDQGVVLPSSLDEPATADAKAAADRFERENNVSLATETKAPTNANMDASRRTAQVYLNGRPVTLPIVPTIDTAAAARARRAAEAYYLGQFARGGVVGPGGGIAGEIGPEILDGRYITTGPTYVRPGTRVTSTSRTRTILHRHHLPRYASGTGNPAPFNITPLTVNVNAAVVGNRYDVMRAVKRASLDRVRLLGARG